MHNEEFSFVHLTDIHVIDAESAELVERAFREIHNLRPLPDFVVIGGDFVENGTQEEFDSFLPVFEKLQIPAYTLCGNHDLVDGIDPTLYQRIFGDPCYAFDHKGYRCIMLDTTHRDYETYSWHGYVRPEAVNWLRGELSRLSGDHPILRGVRPFRSVGSLYKNTPLRSDTTRLLTGSTPEATEPIAWVREHNGGRVFYTSLGHPQDFRDENFQRMLVNALFWAARREPVRR